MHTESPSYSIGHIDHVPPSSYIGPTLAMNPPHTNSMSFMPTLGLHTNPMSMSLTHISSTTPSSPVVVGSLVVGLGSEAKQRDVHVENEQVVRLHSPPQDRPLARNRYGLDTHFGLFTSLHDDFYFGTTNACE